MLNFCLFLVSIGVGALFAKVKKCCKKKIKAKQIQEELLSLQKKFNLEIDSINAQIQKKNPNFQFAKDSINLLQSAEKYQINTDPALILYNKLSFLKEKE